MWERSSMWFATVILHSNGECSDSIYNFGPYANSGQAEKACEKLKVAPEFQGWGNRKVTIKPTMAMSGPKVD
jgi:hypothetical protein